jgi:hypothetical protein
LSDSISRKNGLLSGIDDIREAKFYSDSIAIKGSCELLKDPQHIFNICLNNAGGNFTLLDENLKNMSDKAKAFIQSNEVWNRKELITSIESITEDKGKFVCILAGKSTGKSIVLSDIEKRFPAKVFTVDLRAHPNILTGLMWTLSDRQKLDITDKLKKIFNNVASKFAMRLLDIKNIITEDDLQKYLDIALSKPDTVKSLTKLIDELLTALGGITLVIDEANIALTVSEVTSEADIKATKQALALFTRLTKQTNKVTMP